MAWAALILLLLAALPALVALLPRGGGEPEEERSARRRAGGLDHLAASVQLVLLGAAGAIAAGAGASGQSAPTVLAVLAACLGVAAAGLGGAGPTMVILHLATEGQHRRHTSDVAAPSDAASCPPAADDSPAFSAEAPHPPEEVLRGGTWIGVLERTAVAATLLAGWPEGLAVVLAVKGLARYSELRRPNGAAERFIIGTFASVLWAAACAGVAHLLL